MSKPRERIYGTVPPDDLHTYQHLGEELESVMAQARGFQAVIDGLKMQAESLQHRRWHIVEAYGEDLGEFTYNVDAEGVIRRVADDNANPR